MSETFGLGDVVRLKSGGPAMTVNEKAQAGGLVCVWFAGDDVRHHTFRPEALQAIALSGGAGESAITAKE